MHKHEPPLAKILLAFPDVKMTLANTGSFTGVAKFTAPNGFQCPKGCGWKSPEVVEIFFAPREGAFASEVGVTYDWENQCYV